jgi:hypothetical protein
MPATSATDHTSKKLTLPRVPERGILAMIRWCIAAIPKLAHAAGIQLQIIGSKRSGSNSDGDTTFEIDGSGFGDDSGLRPFAVSNKTKRMIYGVVGGIVPTFSGEPINDPDCPLFTASGSYTIYLKLTFSVTFDAAGALTAWPLSTVEVTTSTTGNTISVKFLPCGSCTAGVFSNSAFSGSLSVSLCNNAANQTTLVYNAA